MGCLFGPAGNSQAFYDSGGKSSVEVPAWLKKIGLSAYEYQAGRGVRVGQETASEIGKKAAENGIAVSIHAPYYINLCTPDPEKLRKSKDHLLKTMRLAQWMGAGKVVFHPGSTGEIGREKAFVNAAKAMEELLTKDIPAWGVTSIKPLPETMGKTNHFGTIQEILEFCRNLELEPAVDFAHIHALGQGNLRSQESFEEIFERIERALGNHVLHRLHIHFSPIEYTSAGEKRHRTTLQPEYGPDFSFLAKALVKYRLGATVICESDGRQAEDALVFKSIYQQILSC